MKSKILCFRNLHKIFIIQFSFLSKVYCSWDTRISKVINLTKCVRYCDSLIHPANNGVYFCSLSLALYFLAVNSF